jgi:hypothetical protein
MLHDFLIRGSGCASFAHYTLRSGTFNHACGSRHRYAHSKMLTLSATVVPIKWPDEGGVDESLPSKVNGLIPVRSAQMPEKRTAPF